MTPRKAFGGNTVRSHGSWHVYDLTAATGAPAAGVPPPAAYVFDAQCTQHVVYVGLESHLYELWWG